MPRSRKKPAKKAAAKGAKAKVQNLDAEEEPEIITVARAARLTPVEAVMVCAGFMSSLAALLTERAVEDIKNYAEEEGVAMTEERAKAQATEEVARILGATRGEEPCDAVQRHAAASGRWLVDALRSAAPPAPPATLLRLLRKTSQLRLRSALPDDDAAVAPLVAARFRAMLPERKTSQRKTLESLDLAGWFAAQQIWLDPRRLANDCTNLDLEHIAAFCGLSILLGGAEGDAREHAICACSAFAAAPEAATVAASAHLPGFLDRLLEFVFLSFEDPNPPGVAGLAAKVGLSATEAPLLSIGEIAARCLVALCQRVPAAVAPLRAAYARATIKEDGGVREVNAMFVFFRTQYDGRWNLSPVGSRGYVFLSLYRRAALDGPPPPRLRSCMACGRDEACALLGLLLRPRLPGGAHGMHKLYCSTDRFVRIRDGDAEEHASQTRVTGSRRSSHAMAKHMPKIAAELGMPWEEILENAKAETMAKMPWRGRQAAAKAIMAKMPGGASESYKSP
ncbi:hypothetical protein JL720_4110 [Aureococcus anophagefferens]|nr:hypothetical protein JL720_4110 [Aureococcus anophagefferens]